MKILAVLFFLLSVSLFLPTANAIIVVKKDNVPTLRLYADRQTEGYRHAPQPQLQGFGLGLDAKEASCSLGKSGDWFCIADVEMGEYKLEYEGYADDEDDYVILHSFRLIYERRGFWQNGELFCIVIHLLFAFSMIVYIVYIMTAYYNSNEFRALQIVKMLDRQNRQGFPNLS